MSHKNSNSELALDAGTTEIIAALRNVEVPKAGSSGVKSSKRKKTSPSKNSDENNMGPMFEELLSCMKAMEERMSKMENKLESFETVLLQRLDKLEEENSSLKKSLQYANTRIDELRLRIDSIEQNERRNQVVISDPSIPSSREGFTDKIKKLIQDKLNLGHELINSLKIRRFGSENRPKALITAQNDCDKVEIIKTTRMKRPTEFYANEYLIPSRSQLLFECRKLKRDFNLEISVYTYGGEVFFKKAGERRSTKVVNFEEFKSVFNV